MQQALGLLIRKAPDNRAARPLRTVGERQERQRSAGEEALPAGCLVRPLVSDVGDQAALAIAATAGADAGQFADPRSTAIRADHEPRTQAAPGLQLHAGTVQALLQAGDPVGAVHPHPRLLRRGPQPVDQQAVLDDPAQLAPPQPVGVEDQRLAAAGIPHLHTAVGLRPGAGNRIPGAQVPEEHGVVGGDGEHPQVRIPGTPGRWLARFHQGDLQAGARQSQRGGGPGDAGAGDDRVQFAAAHAATPGPRHRTGTSPR